MEEKILIVMRDNFLLSKLKKALSQRYTIYETGEFELGIEYYHQHQPHIIIISDLIEGLGGVALSDYIRGQSMDVKIILLLREQISDFQYAKIRSGADYIINYPRTDADINAMLSLPIFDHINFEGSGGFDTEFPMKDVSSGNLKEEMGLFSSLGEYKIISKIAEGGMADVYLAMKQGISGFRKLLVIKLINRLFSHSEDFIKRFMDEAKICAYLNHKNIVQVYDHGRHKQQLFIAMEYVEGIDLANLLIKLPGSIMPPEYVVYVAQELCYGVSYAHNACDDKGRNLKIVHRDLSPQNVLISKSGEVKIADFGVAKSTINHHPSMKKSIVGKLLYMAPEQIQGQGSHASDLYSIGIIMYEMLTGKHPYLPDKNTASPLEIINTILKNNYQPFPKQTEQTTLLEPILCKAIERNLNNRYKTADELLNDLLSLPWGSRQKDFQEFLLPFLKTKS
jgi:serine/threonine protein kinase